MDKNELFPIGERVLFEYHCFESEESCDADLWHHSHQPVTIVSIIEDAEWYKINKEDGGLSTMLERAEVCLPALYRVRFEDGFEGDAFEDELLCSKEEFYRPSPPAIRKKGPLQVE